MSAARGKYVYFMGWAGGARQPSREALEFPHISVVSWDLPVYCGAALRRFIFSRPSKMSGSGFNMLKNP